MGHRLRLGVGAPQSYPFQKWGLRSFPGISTPRSQFSILQYGTIIVEHKITFHLVIRSSLWDEYI